MQVLPKLMYWLCSARNSNSLLCELLKANSKTRAEKKKIKILLKNERAWRYLKDRQTHEPVPVESSDTDLRLRRNLTWLWKRRRSVGKDCSIHGAGPPLEATVLDSVGLEGTVFLDDRGCSTCTDGYWIFSGRPLLCPVWWAPWKVQDRCQGAAGTTSLHCSAETSKGIPPFTRLGGKESEWSAERTKFTLPPSMALFFTSAEPLASFRVMHEQTLSGTRECFFFNRGCIAPAGN